VSNFCVIENKNNMLLQCEFATSVLKGQRHVFVEFKNVVSLSIYINDVSISRTMLPNSP
jgi:hypothetical protein